MATSIVTYTENVYESFDSLSLWLSSKQHTARIQSINVQKPEGYSSTNYILQLPFFNLKQLQSLKLPRCRLEATLAAVLMHAATSNLSPALSTRSAARASASLGALTALSRLELDATMLDLSGLSCCTALQHLSLHDVNHASKPSKVQLAAVSIAEQIQRNAASNGVNMPVQLAVALPHLTKLTHLQLQYIHRKQNQQQKQLATTIASALSNLQRLQGLQLGLGVHATGHLAQLPTRLTALHMLAAPVLTLDTVPHLSRLLALQQLHVLAAKVIDPAALLSLTQITLLALSKCSIRQATAVEELLAALQHLKQLRHLDLTGTLHAVYPNPECFAALTASSELTTLDLHECILSSQAGSHMFRVSCPLAKLIYMATSSDPFSSHHPGCIEQLVACCSALQELYIGDDDMWVLRSAFDEQVGF